MTLAKKAQASLLIAAFVSVVAVVGLVLSDNAAPSGQAVVKGLPSKAYTDYGVRHDSEAVAWDAGVEFGMQIYQANQGNRECITRCGPYCSANQPGNENNCFQWCKSGCEKTQREMVTTGGYYTP